MDGDRAAGGRNGNGDGPQGDPRAAYVFGVTVSLRPETPGVWVEPEALDTTVYRSADPPGEEGWLFFRDNLWRGELTDPRGFRDIVAETLDVPVASVDFRELRASEAYLSALEESIAENLDRFNADSISGAISKYLGSSIRVIGEGDSVR